MNPLFSNNSFALLRELAGSKKRKPKVLVADDADEDSESMTMQQLETSQETDPNVPASPKKFKITYSANQFKR